jgi:hypothetical protein
LNKLIIKGRCKVKSINVAGVFLNINVNHYNLVNKGDLKKKWCELFIHSSHNVFLDWNWISAWLSSFSVCPIVIEARCENKCVGLGLLCHSTQKMCFNLVSLEQLWLHKCGDAKLDQIWIEHNDFLLDKQLESPVRAALLGYIATNVMHWDELYLGMSSKIVVQNFEQTLGKPRTILSSPDFEVTLSHLDTIESYLSSLSKNTRSQITRSKKRLSALGNIKLHLAETESEKTDFFTHMSRLHQKKWRATTMGSGFDNPVFDNFHKHIIFSDLYNHYSGIYALTLNGKPLSFIYILKTDHSWYFYLSGTAPHPDNKIKIGLLTHTFLIEEAIIKGISTYSFLAGHARYKQSMSNNTDGIQELVCFLKPSKLNWFLQKLRQLKSMSFLRLNKKKDK